MKCHMRSHQWSLGDIRSEAKEPGKLLSGGCWQFKFQVISEDGVKDTQSRAERKRGDEDGIIKTEAREGRTHQGQLADSLDSVLRTQEGILRGTTRFNPCPSDLPERTANKP